jgi:RNA polymerase sigma-70 factor (ECF subfamily)
VAKKGSPLAAESSSVETDEQLAEGLKRGDKRAFAEIVRRHSPWMLSVCRRYLKDDARAQDVTQEAFLRVHRYAHTYEGSGSFVGWMRRVTVNAALAELRKHRHEPERSLDELLPTIDDDGCRVESPEWEYHSLEELIDRKNLRQMVLAAIHRLPESHRLVLMLRDIEGYSTAETAEVLGIKEGATKVRLHRARSALKKLLEPILKRGGTP